MATRPTRPDLDEEENEPKAGGTRTRAARPRQGDPATQRELGMIMNPANERDPPQFSCPVPGCKIRVSRVTDAEVVFNPERRIWFCGTSHRDLYEELAG
jgi:hypothetical protein